MSKLRFRIGDYVEVKATICTSYNRSTDRGPVLKTLHRDSLGHKPIRGWIVGMVRRFEGEVSSPTGDDREEYKAGYLGVTGSKLLWKIAQSMTNKPFEVSNEDVELVKIGEYIKRPVCPLRLGAPWGTAGWSPEDQRKEMKAWPRNEKGHWLKKPKGKA